MRRPFRSYFDSGIGGVFHGLQKLVVLWVKRDGEGTVNDSPCGQTPGERRTPVSIQWLMYFETAVKEAERFSQRIPLM